MSERVNEENYQKLCEICTPLLHFAKQSVGAGALCGDEESTVNTVRKKRLFMQNEPNFKIGKITVSYYLTSKYEDFSCFATSENEPKRTQSGFAFSYAETSSGQTQDTRLKTPDKEC